MLADTCRIVLSLRGGELVAIAQSKDTRVYLSDVSAADLRLVRHLDTIRLTSHSCLASFIRIGIPIVAVTWQRFVIRSFVRLMSLQLLRIGKSFGLFEGSDGVMKDAHSTARVMKLAMESKEFRHTIAFLCNS